MKGRKSAKSNSIAAENIIAICEYIPNDIYVTLIDNNSRSADDKYV